MGEPDKGTFPRMTQVLRGMLAWSLCKQNHDRCLLSESRAD